MEQKKTLGQLFVPICLETLCYMLSGMVDTLMLSSVGDAAVGAVGTANTYIGIFIIMFSVISAGMIAVMTQYIGAGREGIAYQARQLGMLFNAIVGAILAVFLFFQSGMILSAVGVADSLMEYAKTYLRIVGGGCILNALIPIFSSYLRAFGYTRQLFGFHYGVAGVAAATVISRVLNLGLVICFGHYYIHAKEKKERLKNRVVFGQIVKIGLPSAMETALYNVAMTLIIRFLNQMDANGMNVTARSYAIQITNFSYCVGAALAQANAIMVGWRIGAQDYEACDKGTRKAAVVGVIVATILESIFALSSHWLIRMFTDDPQMVSLVGKLLAIDIVLEIGRVTNLVYGNALKTSGDAVFTTVIAAIFMYLCAVGGSYFFGIHLGLLVCGAYIGMAMDECVRAVGMILRWRSGKWKQKVLIKENA